MNPDENHNVHNSRIKNAIGREPILFAKLKNVKSLANLLRAVHFKERATCIISRRGLQFVVEDSRCVQARAYLQESMFQEYRFRGDQAETQQEAAESKHGDEEEEDQLVIFGLHLTALIECLNVFGSAGPLTGGSQVGQQGTQGNNLNLFNQPEPFGRMGATACQIEYRGPGADLVVTLEENGIVTLCKLTTQDAEAPLYFNFDSSSVLQKIIMKSEWLRDAFSELDASSENITFLISPVAPFFKLSTFGITGSAEMEYPKDTDVLESFNCNSVVKNSYKFSHIQHSLKALSASIKTSIRTNERGFLSMQFMIPTADAKFSFVEFVCSPLVTDG
ncbi:uncharacterized protein VTP21DRAFT_5922 [Calcarisporiella thermophila]|uniref:uncharacterized protein n=1 Tax=Calcarisporiella thermophila TaxID=911321 RepID=UPI003743A940